MQYLYITNLKGDIVGITDIEGNLIAKYSYDEWGKLLNIETAEENNAEQLSVAQINPLRYRGYYYDTESGLYYLQSRYYNPDLCRFISADGFSYIDTSNYLSLNAYIYCWNCPVAFDDIEGTKPNISINLASIQALLSKSTPEIAARLQEHFDKLQAKFNAFVEKAKFYLQNPDVFINKMLSKLLGREVNIRFRLLEYIKANIHKSDDEEENSENGISTYAFTPNIAADEKTDNWFAAALKTLLWVMEADYISKFFESMVQSINSSFNLDKWFEKLPSKIKNYFGELMIDSVTVLNTMHSYIINKFGEDFLKSIKDWSIGELIGKIAGEQISSMIDIFNVFKSGKENFDGNHSIDYSFIATFIDIGSFLISIVFPYFAISTDMGNELMKLIMSNIDYGKIWG